MTVRISKPEFNLREKISELDKPTGVKGNELLRSETTQEARDIIGAGRKNMVINGQMFINQRNGTSSYTIPHGTGGSYGGPDRWAVNEATDGSVSVNMDGDPYGGNGAGSEVQEFERAFQIACSGTSGGLSSTHNVHFFQNIEGYNIIPLGWGTPGAKSATLSFWVRSNVYGIYCVGLENNGTDRCCIREYELKPGFKWQKVILTFPPCPDGTWNVTNGTGIRLRFALASGSQYDDGIDGQWVNSDELTTGNQVNFMSSTNNRFFITGVQLEVGKNATNFEHRSYGEELALCQRYFYINGGSEHKIISQAFSPHTTEIAIAWPHPTEMRASPTINIVGTETSNKNANFYFRTINNTGFSLTGNGYSIVQMTKHHFSLWFNGMSNVPAVPGQVRVQVGCTAHIHVTAEL